MVADLKELESKLIGLYLVLDEYAIAINYAFKIFEIFGVEVFGNISIRICPLTNIIILHKLLKIMMIIQNVFFRMIAG